MKCRFGTLSEELTVRCKALKITIIPMESLDPGYILECPHGYHLKNTGYHCIYAVYPGDEPSALDDLSGGIEYCAETTPCESMEADEGCYWQNI